MQRVLTPWAASERRRDPLRRLQARARSWTRSASSSTTPALIWDKTVGAARALRRRRSAIAIVIAIPIGSCSATLHRGSFLAINVSNIGRALPSLAVIAIGLCGLRHRLHERDVRARRARRPADPHERVRGGRRRRAATSVEAARGMGMRQRRRAAPGRAAARAAADLRRHPHGRRLRRRDGDDRRASPAAAGSATSSSTRRATGCAACSAPRSASLRSRSLPTSRSARPAAVTPRGSRRRRRLRADDAPPGRRSDAVGLPRQARHGAPDGREGDSDQEAHAARREGRLLHLVRRRARLQADSPRPRHPRRPQRPTIKLGTKNFTEEFILGQLYKQALEAKGFKVDYNENIGSTEIIDTALTSGQDQRLSGVHRRRSSRPSSTRRPSPKTAAAALAQAKALSAKRGITLLNADAVLRHRRDRRC